MKHVLNNAFAVIICVACGMLPLSGCATMPLRHPVPFDLVDKASVNNMAEIRMISGENDTMLQNDLLESAKQEAPGDFSTGPDGSKIYSILAISGGGAEGAYGAGLLKGWSQTGSRPIFKVVTGVSTGAIIAPFAFLGKEYDEGLETLYTTMSTKDVMTSNGLLGPLFGDSLASNRPLVKKLAVSYDENMLKKIAEEHKHGRRLFVGTVNLDAQRFVIWDMGAIACRGDIGLFRKVILASAAIPVTFSPVIFHVDAAGKPYDEMHVDGGTLTQVFTTYVLLKGMEAAIIKMGIDPAKIKSKLYIIRNGYVSPNYMKVQDAFSPIVERAIDTMIDAQGVGDIYRIYYFTKERGGDFNLAFIPPDFKPEGKEMFDIKEMRRLFERGYGDAFGGYKWHKEPPLVLAPKEEAGK